MSELIAFVEARLAEDERIARAAILSMSDTGDWDAHHGAGLATVKIRGYYIVAGEMADETAEHIVRHDPARALREVEAKRHMIERAKRHQAWAENDPTPAFKALATASQIMLAFMATVWAEHPDYRAEWRADQVVA